MFPYNNVYELFFLYFNSDKRFKHYPSPKKLSLTPFIAFRIFEQNKKKTYPKSSQFLNSKILWPDFRQRGFRVNVFSCRCFGLITREILEWLLLGIFYSKRLEWLEVKGRMQEIRFFCKIQALGKKWENFKISDKMKSA